MYIWNIEKLKSDLGDSGISEKESLKYLAVSIALSFLVMFSLLTYTGDILDYYLMFLESIIFIFGTFYVFSKNKGNEGKNFLSRFFSIGFVVGVRWFIIIILTLIPVSIIINFLLVFFKFSEEIKEIISESFIIILFYLIYVYLVGKHIEDVAEEYKK